MATVNDLREVISWGALSAHDQWSAGTRWDNERERPTDREIVTKVQAGMEISGGDLKRFEIEYE